MPASRSCSTARDPRRWPLALPAGAPSTLALKEIDEGAEEPSIQWRRDFSLLLGLERLLADEPPKLRDGAELNPHQVDALSGTLTELMSEQQTAAENGDAPVAADVAESATDGKGAEEDEDEDDDEEPEDLAPDEEPQDWEEEPAEEDDEEAVAEAADDPGAARRFWFEHATGAGKTVAAVGFIDATRTGGVLILTHRRNLVEQFIGEISDRGYKERLRPPLLGRSRRR